MSLLEKSLIVLLIFTTSLALYFFTKRGKGEDTDELNPLDSGLISWFALLFVFIIFCAFIYFRENKFSVPENIGQVGDFIGGLTNPVLSFLALLVLLRTTSIQASEARKTTSFMAKQQAIMEKEKFENTFFQLLAQLESYCDKHLRTLKNGVSEGQRLARELRLKKAEFDGLDSEEQSKEAISYINGVADTTECIMLYHRAMRVVRFINRSELSSGFKSSYASVVRDTIYPAECIIISSLAYQYDPDKKLLKAWGVVDLNRGSFVCAEIENYYLGKP